MDTEPQTEGVKLEVSRGTLFEDRQTLFKKLKKLPKARVKDICSSLLPSCWATNNRYIKGKPFTFVGREFFIEPCDVRTHKLVLMTCSQVGKTNIWMNRAFHGGVYKGISCFIMFPSLGNVGDFSKGKFEEAYKSSPQLAEFFTDVDNIGHKRAGHVEFFLRGPAIGGLQTVTAALVVVDEIDLCPEKSVRTVLQRRTGEEEKWLIYVSTPTVPGYGIHKEFDKSDQRWWHVRCPGCGKLQIITWPEKDGEEGNVEWRDLPESVARWNSARYRCKFSHCHKVWEKGQFREMQRTAHYEDPAAGWIAKYPGRDVTGFAGISHMVSPTVTPAEMLESWEGTKKNPNLLDTFWNYDMGLPFLTEGQRLGKDLLMDILGRSDYMSQSISVGSFMGVDVQKHCLYAMVAEYPFGWEGRKKVIWAGKVENFNQLAQMMDSFRVIRCVIDGNYDYRSVKLFQNQFPQRVWACWYSLGDKQHIRISENKPDVFLNRVYWLDHTAARVRQYMETFPRDVSMELIEHYQGLTRKVEQDEETGKKIAYYLRNGDDHLYHASCYCEVAACDWEGFQEEAGKGGINQPSVPGEFFV